MNAMERLNNLVMKKGPVLAEFDFDLVKMKALYEKIGKFSRKSYADVRDYIEEIVIDYSKEYIQAVKDSVAAIRINFVSFKSYGREKDLFWKIVKKAKELGLFVIADFEKADIRRLSDHDEILLLLSKYSGVDAIIINPYFATDKVKLLLNRAKENEKAVFAIVIKPEPSGVQRFAMENGKIGYQVIAESVKKWGEYTKTSEDEKYSLVGAVIGSTHLKEVKRLREQLPNTFFLVPGYGTNDITAEDVAVNFDNFGGGAIVNSSRGLMFSCEKEPWKSENSVEDWPKATAEAAANFQKELLNAILASRS